MLPRVSSITIAAVTALALAVPGPALAWGKKEQNFLAGIAAAVAVGALIKQGNRANARTAPGTYPPAPVYGTPAPVYDDPVYTSPVYNEPVYNDPVYTAPSHSGTTAANAFREFSPNGRRAIQQRLAEAGYYRGAIDGVWGARTAAAVEAYARDTGALASLSSRDGTVRLFNGMIG